ncbi:hypothetical protein, partial [Aeromonas sp. BIGb0405]|jgi:hypothetical protein|uniref:hypothetical protein n=1 Tax=Aeromonas sp. BIGb0405 TaxID=2940592 RepID=UPI002168D301
LQRFVAAGVAFYSTAFSSQALFGKAFFEAPTGLFALPLALSMEAHYRELKCAGKGVSVKKYAFLTISCRVAI